MGPARIAYNGGLILVINYLVAGTTSKAGDDARFGMI